MSPPSSDDTRRQRARRWADDAASAGRLPVPDTLLFNGGVFRAAALAERLQPPRRLARRRAARPAQRQSRCRRRPRRGRLRARPPGHGRAHRRRLGAQLLPGLEEQAQQRRGICLLPRGSEEGHEIRLPERTFSLRLGQPVRFHLASSVADTSYLPGEIATLDDEDFVRLPPIATVVQAPAGSSQRDVRVQLITAMTEVGTLELHCVSSEDAARRWLLEFQLRGDDASEALASPAALPARFADAVQWIERIFGASSQPVDSKEVRRLRGQLEHLLGKRDDWEMPVLRALFDALMQRARRRRRSPEHERLWLNLAGFCLRPGLGDALDEWRIEQLCEIASAGNPVRQREPELVGMVDALAARRRRPAAGHPGKLLAELAPWLRSEPTKTRSRLPAAIAGSHDDMLRLVASLERLPIERKVEVGDWLLERLRKASEKPLGWWALGRLGARQSLYGSAHQVVPPEVAGRWLEAVLASDWKKVEPAAFAATQIARLTGDRTRDLPEDAREATLARLATINASASWVAQVRTVIELDKADERRAFGESLPAGLRLIGENRAS
jgi:hypothetical protein